MSLNIVIQMDPIESIDITKDSTFALALAAQERGHHLFYYTPKDLVLDGNVAKAYIRPLTVQNIESNHYQLGGVTLTEIEAMDVVLIRQDPPFDMRYITSTYILERVKGKTLIINNPTEIRNCPEKLLVTNFQELTPRTCITESPDMIKDFYDQHQDIILKPLYGCGGMDIFRVSKQQENLNAIIEVLQRLHDCPMVAQRYLPEIKEGDKRIILIDGKAVGATSRMPASDEVRANFHAGGVARKAEITESDQRICDAIGSVLREKQLFFVGIDVIGEYLTEINVTSPTGIHEINQLNDIKIEDDFWDVVENKLSH